MTRLDKILRLGTNKTQGGRYYSVYAHVRILHCELHITGVGGPLQGGNAIGDQGQLILDNGLVIENLASDWTPEMLSTFRFVWDRWHLNHTNAQCEHQRQLGQTWTTHPLSECITCGYVLGSQWLCEALPETVVSFLESLPETKKIPAWI
tara:strand:+ start:417 stop:866 length:450 start_codon:yes stop_codon:yes gene_type:complete